MDTIEHIKAAISMLSASDFEEISAWVNVSEIIRKLYPPTSDLEAHRRYHAYYENRLEVSPIFSKNPGPQEGHAGITITYDFGGSETPRSGNGMTAVGQITNMIYDVRYGSADKNTPIVTFTRDWPRGPKI